MYRSLAVALSLASMTILSCAGSLAPVRAVEPAGDELAELQWPDYVSAEDRELLAAAEERIGEVRQGELLVRVQTPYGVPVPDVTINWRQESRQFAFGVDTKFDSAVWGDLLRGGIDIGVAALDWASTEPEPDVWRVESAAEKNGLAVLPQMGVRMMASAALWMTPGGTPAWVRQLSGPELEEAAERHVSGLVERLRGQVVMWEAVRDPNPEWTAAVGRDSALIGRLAKASTRAIRALDPVTPIAITWVDPLRSSGALGPLALSSQLEKAGAEYDVVGLHYLYNGYTGALRPTGQRSLGAIAKNLDDFALLGKPIGITAVSVPSEPRPGGDGPGFWGRSWDQELQAAYLKAFYVLAYSKQAVRSITWRDAVDDGAAIFGGGLFERAGTPKQSWYALRGLMERWTSAGEADGDRWGQVRFRGYGGTYRIEVTDQFTGRVHLATAVVRERELTQITIRLPEELTRHVEQDVVETRKP